MLGVPLSVWFCREVLRADKELVKKSGDDYKCYTHNVKLYSPFLFSISKLSDCKNHLG